jgi:PAT family beta-lactamase induction signal transducer AmpG
MKATTGVSAQHIGNLPALSEHPVLRYFNFIALYIAQGIPEGMTFFGIPAWLAMNGKTPGEIGTFVAVMGLPWSFKIIVAPLMDRFSYLPMGRRRPWVLFGQMGLILSFIAMSFVPDPLNNLSTLMLAGFFVSFFGAFQDVATDGMAIDIVPVHQQARANGFMWGAKIMGTAASLAGGTWLLNAYGFSAAILMLSIIIGLIMLAPLLLRERKGEKLLPWMSGEASHETIKMKVRSWKEIISSLYKVFSLRNSLLFALFAFLTAAAFNYLDTLIPIFTVQELGWTDQAYAKFYASATLVGGISGMLLGGVLIDKFGKMRMLNVYLFLLVILISSLSVLKSSWSHTWFITGFMLMFQVLYVFSLIGIFATAMQCCWKKVSATQFTLYMTISNLGRMAGAKMIGPVKEQFSWQYSIFACVIVLALAWLLLQFILISKQEKRVRALEERETTQMPAMA